MRHWLMKTGPDMVAYDDLLGERRAGWDGVRNYQARNFMCDMRRGDLVVDYHSPVKLPGVAGIFHVLSHPETQADLGRSQQDS